VDFLANQDSDEFEFNLIPLIDVMLTLLIFFMVSTTFEERALLKVTLPQASENPVRTANIGLAVIIDAQGRYFVDQREVLRPDAASLRAALEPHAGADRSQQVVVRADARTPHQAVTTALDVLGQLGFVRIAIATVPIEEGD
jgi:biopolymer transport protein ExbD